MQPKMGVREEGGRDGEKKGPIYMDDGDDGDVTTEGDQVREEEQREEGGPQVREVRETHQHKLCHQSGVIFPLLFRSLRRKNRVNAKEQVARCLLCSKDLCRKRIILVS